MCPLLKNVITEQSQSTITVGNKSMCLDVASWLKEILEGTVVFAGSIQDNSTHLHIAKVGISMLVTATSCIQCILVMKITMCIEDYL